MLEKIKFSLSKIFHFLQTLVIYMLCLVSLARYGKFILFEFITTLYLLFTSFYIPTFLTALSLFYFFFFFFRQIRQGNAQNTRGTAYVVYDSQSDAHNAFNKLSGFNYQNRYLVVLFHSVSRMQKSQLDLDARRAALEELKQQNGL